MAETIDEKQDRLAAQFQSILQDENPEMDIAPGSVMYELTVKPNASLLAKQEAGLDVMRENMSLIQVLNQEDPDQIMVDRLLSNFNVARREGARAVGTLNIYTRSTQNVSVTQAQRFFCGGIELQPLKSYVGVNGDVLPNDTESLSYVQMRQFNETTFVFTIEASTVDVMKSVLSPGQDCTATPPIPQVTKAEVASTFTGGSVEENTNSLLQRARTQMNAHVLTGRDNIKAFLSDNGVIDVLDAAVFGMGDDLMLRDNRYGSSGGGSVDAYIRTAVVPASVVTVLSGIRDVNDVWTVEIPTDDFPGAYGVVQIKYGENVITEYTEIVGFDTQLGAPWINEAAHARYSVYQTLSVQFTAWDIVIAEDTASFEVTVLYMPGLQSLQDLVEEPDVRSYGFDMLIKGSVPVVVDVDVTINYWKGLDVPEESEFQLAIANTINGKLTGEEFLQASEIVYACKRLFPQGEIAMPVNMFARTWLPEGGSVYSSSQSYVKVPDIEGLSYRNSVFACFPNSINVSLIEVVPQ